MNWFDVVVWLVASSVAATLYGLGECDMRGIARNERRARDLMARYVPAHLMRGWLARQQMRIPSPSDADITYLYVYGERLGVYYKGAHIANFCISPIGQNRRSCPRSDAAMAMYISITYNEDEFLATGNFFTGRYEIARACTDEEQAKLNELCVRQNALRNRGLTMDARERQRALRPPPARPTFPGVASPQISISFVGTTVNVATMTFSFPLPTVITLVLDGANTPVVTSH